MGTYCKDSDLILDNGRELDEIFLPSLSDDDITSMKARLRLRIFNHINDNYLMGRTAVPAMHIPALNGIERDLVIASLLRAAYTMEGPNRSDWSRDYEERAVKSLENLRFSASVDNVFEDPGNTGDGTISNIITNDETTRTETWIIGARTATEFSIHGSITGYLRALTVDVDYPEKDWSHLYEDYNFSTEYSADIRFEEYPISLLINSGDTAFVDNDKFTFRTYAASFRKNLGGKIIRG